MLPMTKRHKELYLSLARSMGRYAWGPIQTQKKLKGERLIWHFTTAGHGGYVWVVSEAEALATPWLKKYVESSEYNQLKRLTDGTSFYVLDFEEDCAWALLPYHMPDVCGAMGKEWVGCPNAEKVYQSAAGTVERWFPDFFDEKDRALVEARKAELRAEYDSRLVEA